MKGFALFLGQKPKPEIHPFFVFAVKSLLEKPYWLFGCLFLLPCCAGMPCTLHNMEGGGNRWRVQRVAECHPPAALSRAHKNLCRPGGV